MQLTDVELLAIDFTRKEEVENLKHELYNDFSWMQLTDVELLAIDFTRKEENFIDKIFWCQKIA